VRLKGYVNENLQWHHRESKPRTSASTNCAMACQMAVGVPVVKSVMKLRYEIRYCKILKKNCGLWVSYKNGPDNTTSHQAHIKYFFMIKIIHIFWLDAK